MALSTQDQVLAGGRHVFSYLGGAVTMFAALHLITGGDAESASKALSQIGNGFAEIITGAGTLVAVISGVYATWSANPLVQFLKGSKAVAAAPEIVKGAKVSDADQAAVATAAVQLPKVDSVVAAPEVANSVPSPAVQSSGDVKVINK